MIFLDELAGGRLRRRRGCASPSSSLCPTASSAFLLPLLVLLALAPLAPGPSLQVL